MAGREGGVRVGVGAALDWAALDWEASLRRTGLQFCFMPSQGSLNSQGKSHMHLF